MQIKANKSELLAVLKRVLPYVERKQTIPILTNLLIVAESDHITVSATDLDAALTVTLGCKVMKEGTITVPARKLADTLAKLKTLEDAEVGIVEGENHWIHLSCGPLTVKLVGMKSTNFPSLAKWPEAKPLVDVTGEVLNGLIHRTRYAISTEESRYTLNGALLTFDANCVRMVATDGHQLALAEHAGNWTPMRMLIPSDSVDRLHDLAEFEGKRSIIFAHDETRIYAQGEDWMFQSRILTGQFPNWEAVMPTNNLRRVTVAGKTLAATVARVASFADERSLATRWQMIGGKGLKVSASSTESGEASEMLPISCEDDVLIGLSAGYVQNILKALGKDQTVTLAVKDCQSATLWIPAETGAWKWNSILMPTRL